MNQIEKVARAICRADPEVRMGDADGVVEQRVNIEWVHYVGAAKAAIAAMTVQSEPVAWLYERDDGSRDLLLDCNGEYACNLLELGATETPLYAHPPVPQWQGIETAPRDGTLILVPAGHGIMDVVSWWGGAWRETANALAIRDEPTHWMPLPTPPNGGSDAE